MSQLNKFGTNVMIYGILGIINALINLIRSFIIQIFIQAMETRYLATINGVISIITGLLTLISSGILIYGIIQVNNSYHSKKLEYMMILIIISLILRFLQVLFFGFLFALLNISNSTIYTIASTIIGLVFAIPGIIASFFFYQWGKELNRLNPSFSVLGFTIIVVMQIMNLVLPLFYIVDSNLIIYVTYVVNFLFSAIFFIGWIIAGFTVQKHSFSFGEPKIGEIGYVSTESKLKYCSICGTKMETYMDYCQNCGNTLK